MTDSVIRCGACDKPFVSFRMWSDHQAECDQLLAELDFAAELEGDAPPDPDVDAKYDPDLVNDFRRENPRTQE